MGAVKRAPSRGASGAAVSLKCSGRMPQITMPLWATRLASTGAIGTVVKGSSSWLPFTRAGTKFMGGEPMKPATNRLTGCS